MNSFRLAILSIASVAACWTSVAQAQTTHSINGSLFMGNPSAGATRELTLPNPSDVTIPQIQTMGAPVATPTSMQGPGLSIVLPADQWRMSGSKMRTFMSFPSVAQNTEVFTTTHADVTFAPGGGVGALSWCPQITGCGTYMDATVLSGQGFIGALPGPNTFGGAFRLLRSITGGVWFVSNIGVTLEKIVVFSPNVRNVPWSAGITNAEQVVDTNPGVTSVRINALLGPNGSITDPGTAVPPPTMTDAPDGIATGFKMTTGTLVFSDETPATVGGGAFTSTQAGSDQRTNGGEGNIQLIGGAVAYGGFTGNVFYRITRLTMQVPEPASLMGLGFGLVALAGLTQFRRRD